MIIIINVTPGIIESLKVLPILINLNFSSNTSLPQKHTARISCSWYYSKSMVREYSGKLYSIKANRWKARETECLGAVLSVVLH